MDEPTYHNETTEDTEYVNYSMTEGDPDAVTTQPSKHHHHHHHHHHQHDHHDDLPDNGVSKKKGVVINSEKDLARVDASGTRNSHQATKAKYEITGAEKRQEGNFSQSPTLNPRTYTIYADGNQNNREWASELFYSINGKPHHRSCKKNALTALKDCCSLPCTMCIIASRQGDPWYLPCVPCTGPAIRFKVRVVGGIKGTILNDCLVTTCCWPCAYCQILRELDEIGL